MMRVYAEPENIISYKLTACDSSLTEPENLFTLDFSLPVNPPENFEINSIGKGDLAHLTDIIWITRTDITTENTGTRIVQKSVIHFKNKRNEPVMTLVYRYDIDHKTARFYIKDSRGITAKTYILGDCQYFIPVWALPEFLTVLTRDSTTGNDTFNIITFESEKSNCPAQISGDSLILKNAHLTIKSKNSTIRIIKQQ